MRYWAPDEDATLRRDYGRLPADEIAQRLARTVFSIRHRAKQLGLKSRRTWTAAEDEMLRQSWGKIRSRLLAEQIGRTVSALKQRAIRLGLDAEWNYTDEERALVRRLYPTHTAAQIAERIFGTPKAAGAIFRLAYKLRLRKWPSWPPETIAKVAELHGQGLGDMEIGRNLDMTRNQVHALRYDRLKLPANQEAIRRAHQQSVRTQYRRLGITSPGMLRVWSFKKFARARGWPEDLRPRAVQMLETLLACGPMTRRQIAAAIGMPWKGSRKSLVSNDPEGTYLAYLAKVGLVVMSDGRPVRGNRRGSSLRLYFASPEAERMKHEWQEKQADRRSALERSA